MVAIAIDVALPDSHGLLRLPIAVIRYLGWLRHNVGPGGSIDVGRLWMIRGEGLGCFARLGRSWKGSCTHRGRGARGHHACRQDRDRPKVPRVPTSHAAVGVAVPPGTSGVAVGRGVGSREPIRWGTIKSVVLVSHGRRRDGLTNSEAHRRSLRRSAALPAPASTRAQRGLESWKPRRNRWPASRRGHTSWNLMKKPSS